MLPCGNITILCYLTDMLNHNKFTAGASLSKTIDLDCFNKYTIFNHVGRDSTKRINKNDNVIKE